MGVHARAVILEQWLWHHRDRLATAPADVLVDVFVEQHLVGHLRQGRVLQIDFGLTGGADFLVVDFDNGSAPLQRPYHLKPNILLMIHWPPHGRALLLALFVTTCLP